MRECSRNCFAWKFFSSSRGNSRFKHGSVIVHNIFAYFTLSLSTAQIHMFKERCWFSKSLSFFSTFHVGLMFCFLPTSFYIVHRQEVLVLGQQISIPNSEPSPNRTSIGFSQIAFPITVLPKDDRTDLAQEERLGLPCWTMIWVICALVDVSKYLDILTLEFSVTLTHLPF